MARRPGAGTAPSQACLLAACACPQNLPAHRLPLWRPGRPLPLPDPRPTPCRYPPPTHPPTCRCSEPSENPALPRRAHSCMLTQPFDLHGREADVDVMLEAKVCAGGCLLAVCRLLLVWARWPGWCTAGGRARADGRRRPLRCRAWSGRCCSIATSCSWGASRRRRRRRRAAPPPPGGPCSSESAHCRSGGPCQ